MGDEYTVSVRPNAADLHHARVRGEAEMSEHRPGAVVVAGEVAGTWRPKAQGKRFTLRLDPWVPLSATVRAAVETRAERLATHRGVTLDGVVGH